MLKTSFLFLAIILTTGQFASAQVVSSVLEKSYLKDRNGDGILRVVAFGDSITRGTGDYTPPNEEVEIPTQPTSEAGYPLRLEGYLGIPISNAGKPGDEISNDGIPRFVRVLNTQNPDVVIFSMGANDVFDLLGSKTYFHLLQTAVNIAQARGIQVILGTILPTCCNRIGSRPFIDIYDAEIQRVVRSNDLPIADIYRAFRSTCTTLDECQLLNRPEGLHPNAAGHDVIAEVVTAALLKIDIFSTDCALKFEQALNLQTGSVKTKPDQTATLETSATE
jgi:lysophospholipase L1-like esterase